MISYIKQVYLCINACMCCETSRMHVWKFNLMKSENVLEKYSSCTHAFIQNRPIFTNFLIFFSHCHYLMLGAYALSATKFQMEFLKQRVFRLTSPYRIFSLHTLVTRLVSEYICKTLLHSFIGKTIPFIKEDRLIL